jgi:hypothetical protein
MTGSYSITQLLGPKRCDQCAGVIDTGAEALSPNGHADVYLHERCAAAWEDVEDSGLETYTDDELVNLDIAEGDVKRILDEVVRRWKRDRERLASPLQKVELVGVTEVMPEELATNGVGVYRVTPPGWDEDLPPSKQPSALMPHYVKYLAVPGGWMVELLYPGEPRAGMRATYVPRPALK